MTPKEKVEAGIQRLKEDGHTVETKLVGEQCTQWFEVDGRMRVSWEEMQNLGVGTYSLAELEEEFKQRAAK